MRTFTLFTVILSVALGKPLEEQKEAQVVLPETLQRPLVGDLLPAQSHVVVENPAPQPQLVKLPQMSAPSAENKEQEGPVYEVVEDLTKDNNEIEVEAAGKVSLESEPNEELQMIKYNYAEGEVKVDYNNMEEKYGFEQPIMDLEPLTDEEMQRDEHLEVYEEPGAVEGQIMNDRDVPDGVMEEDGPMLDALGEPLTEGGFMRMDPLAAERQSVHAEPGARLCSGVAFGDKCFQFFPDPKKASDAEYFCQERFPSGHLASITSQDLRNEMMNLMRRHGGTRRTWVGGLRFLDTGRFVWLDGSHWGYADWLWGEPNNTSNVENCVELLASGKFNDFTCWEPQAFICSYPNQ